MKSALACIFVSAQLLFPATPENSIRQVLTDQQSAWNRGNLEEFMRGYDHSPATIFIGKSITKGHAAVLASYKARYSTPEIMGKLEFTAVEVKLLDERFGFVTGLYRLSRKPAGGGDASGIFSLLFERKPSGWVIIADHTS